MEFLQPSKRNEGNFRRKTEEKKLQQRRFF